MDKGYIQCSLERGSSDSKYTIIIPYSLHYLMPCDGWARFTPAEIQMMMSKYARHRGRPLPDLTVVQEEKCQRELLEALDIYQRIFNAMGKYSAFWLNYVKT